MSDMYLELKTRIPVIAAKTHIGRERLQTAQDNVGLSNERVARLIPVSEKTWRRWKDAGEVPTASLRRVAEVLRMELVSAAPTPVEIEPQIRTLQEEVSASLAALLDGQGEILARLSRLEAALDGLASRPPTRRARRRPAG
jgi:hypothetical protein